MDRRKLSLDANDMYNLFFFQSQKYEASEQDEQSKSIQDRMKAYIKLIISKEITERQRTIFMMKTVNEMNAEDIANELNIKPATVYKHLRLTEKIMLKFCRYFFTANGIDYSNYWKNKIISEIRTLPKPKSDYVYDYWICGIGVAGIAKKYGVQYQEVSNALRCTYKRFHNQNIGTKELNRIRSLAGNDK